MNVSKHAKNSCVWNEKVNQAVFQDKVNLGGMKALQLQNVLCICIKLKIILFDILYYIKSIHMNIYILKIVNI